MTHKGIHRRGYLPHWDFADSVQGITFRLADSVPAEVIAEWRDELQSLLKSPDPEISSTAQADLHRKIAKYEDAGYGRCDLADAECAGIVQEALKAGHGASYKLTEWCVMPNHVHVLIRLLGPTTLGGIVKRWKGGTAVQINRLLGHSGSLWMRDYHDRFIRDLDHFHNAKAYIRNNPVKAGLCVTPEEWVSSSAGCAWAPVVTSSSFPKQAK
jgi:REP element-mobilizing transposase RayT